MVLDEETLYSDSSLETPSSQAQGILFSLNCTRTFISDRFDE